MEQELVELFDENRVSLGKIRPRGEKLEPGEFLVVVGSWVFNSKGEILLTKRHPDKKFAPNLWENTGGHVSAGESSEEAMARELFEETGIRCRAEEFRLLGTVKVPPFWGDNYCIFRDLDVSEVVLQPGETCEAKWVTLSEFNRMIETEELAPSVTANLQHYREKWEKARQEACK